MTTSVLRAADQRKGRLPPWCVITGLPTTNAIRVWATTRGRFRRLYPLLRPVRYVVARGRAPRAMAVVLPLSPEAWRRRRNIVAASGVAGGMGGALIVIGATGSSVALVAGLVVFATVVAARVRFDGRHWVQVWLKQGGEEILVTNTSAAFDAAARELFIRRSPG